MSANVKIEITSNRELVHGTLFPTKEIIRESQAITQQIPYDTPHPLVTPKGDNVKITVISPPAIPFQPANTTTFDKAKNIIVPTTQKATWPWRALKISTEIVALCGTIGTNRGLFGFLADNCKIASTYLAPLGGSCMFFGGQKIVTVLSDMLSSNSLSTAEKVEELAMGLSFCALGTLSIFQTQKLCV